LAQVSWAMNFELCD